MAAVYASKQDVGSPVCLPKARKHSPIMSENVQRLKTGHSSEHVKGPLLHTSNRIKKVGDPLSPLSPNQMVSNFGHVSQSFGKPAAKTLHGDENVYKTVEHF